MILRALKRPWPSVVMLALVLVLATGCWQLIRSDAEPGQPVNILWGFASYTKARPHRDILARVEDATGTFRLSASVGDRAPFWSNHQLTNALPSAYTAFDLAGKWVQACYAAPGCANRAHEHLGNIVLTSNATGVDEAYRVAVTQWWQGVSPFLQRRPDSKIGASSIGSELRDGPNSMNVQITPIGSPAQPWSLTIVITQRDAQGQESKLRQISIDQSTPAKSRSDGMREITLQI
jgi:hypothetical protein